MINGLEIVLLKDFQRLGTAAAGSAVEEISFGFIEGIDALLEIGAVKINVRCAGYVERLEFLRRANIEDDEVRLRKQFLSAPGVDVFDRGGGGTVGGGGGLETNRKAKHQSLAKKTCGGRGHNFLVVCSNFNNTEITVSPAQSCCQQRLKVNTSETMS